MCIVLSSAQFALYLMQRVKATVEVRKAMHTKLEEMIRNEEPVKEVHANHMIYLHYVIDDSVSDLLLM